jgi:hypothetical protein
LAGQLRHLRVSSYYAPVIAFGPKNHILANTYEVEQAIPAKLAYHHHKECYTRQLTPAAQT